MVEGSKRLTCFDPIIAQKDVRIDQRQINTTTTVIVTIITVTIITTNLIYFYIDTSDVTVS